MVGRMYIDRSKLLWLSFLFILKNIILTFSIINALVVLVTTCIAFWVLVYVVTILLDILIFILIFIVMYCDVSPFLFISLIFLIFFASLGFWAYYTGNYSYNLFAESYLAISLIILQGWVFNLVYATPLSIRIGKVLDSNIIAISGLLYPPLVTSLLGSILFLLGVIISLEKKFP
jgi:hypothetical protein